MKKIFYSMLVAAMTAFSFTSCEDVPAPYDLPNGSDNGGNGDNTELKTLYSETFDNNTTAFAFKDVNLTGGLSYVWKVASYNNNGYLNASAFASNASHASESWAVSPAINLTDSKKAVLSFSHAINKLNDTSTMKDMMTAWVSTDYAGDVAAATWKQVTIPTYPAGTSWSFVESGDIDLTEFCGNNAYIAFKYTSTDDNSGGWEVDNFTVKGDGTPTSTPDNPGTDNPGTDPSNPTGEGTEANPYSVSAAIAKAAATNVYVKGYIVGCVNDKALSSASFDASNFTGTTNILVAESADETDVTKCMPVQLPAGDVRNGLNLSENAANHKKAVVLYGNIEKYFGTTGIKSVTYAKVGDTEFGKKPDTTTPDQPTGDVLYSETFASGVGTFTIKDVELGGLTYVWTHSTYNNSSYMKGSAYASNAAHAAESWLVSASVDLTKASNATLTFEQAVNKINDGKVADCCAVLVSSNYSGDVAAATWETLSVDNVPAGTDWNFVTSTASLKSFAGKKVTIAFRYKSTTSVAPTWEVKNVVVK